MRETPRAAQAFYEYCLLEDRSLVKLAEKLGQSVGKARVRLATLETWSSVHNWQERVRAYDKGQFDEKRRKHNKAIEDMNERQARLGVSLQAKGFKQADDLLERGAVDASEALRMIKIGTDLERVARGAPTEYTEQTVNTSGVAVYLPQKKEMDERG